MQNVVSMHVFLSSYLIDGGVTCNALSLLHYVDRQNLSYERIPDQALQTSGVEF